LQTLNVRRDLTLVACELGGKLGPFVNQSKHLLLNSGGQLTRSGIVELGALHALDGADFLRLAKNVADE